MFILQGKLNGLTADSRVGENYVLISGNFWE